ncbi:MAG TPA: 16S rRNA (cytosine(1402)-N(4))-methyltransferase RsmH [Rhizomicrobium sp.]|jgi:16S rRNA (cytosine1402-N4)-methyltransferase
MSGHIPVMLEEVVEAMQPRDGAHYVDGTFGGGGYAKALLDAAQCRVLGIDRDPTAIARGRELAARYDGRLTMVQGEFSQMDDFLGGAKTDGVMLDLGVSSYQIDEADRGFSFRFDGPLDMRMSGEGESAADVVNTADEATLTRIIGQLGEERFARKIAKAIVAARPLSRTAELADIVSKALGPAAKRFAIHPATRTFQGLRLHVNDELGELERGLEAAERALAPQGRLAVVSFHSLEDRIVKRFLTERGREAATSRHAPEAARKSLSFRLVARRQPGDEEISRNPRARSARLRVAERLAA